MLEDCLGRMAIKNLMPLQAVCMPATAVAYGVRAFVDWYRAYYKA